MSHNPEMNIHYTNSEKSSGTVRPIREKDECGRCGVCKCLFIESELSEIQRTLDIPIEECRYYEAPIEKCDVCKAGIGNMYVCEHCGTPVP